MGAHLRGGHRPDHRRAVRKDRRAHGHARGGQRRLSDGVALAARAAGHVVAGGGHRADGHLRGHGDGAGPVSGQRRRERIVLCGSAAGRTPGRRCPGGAFGGAVRLLLNYYLIAPRHSFTIAEPNSAITELVLLLIAVAVAVLVDGATKRAREARRASQEAELLTLFAGSVLRGADLETLLERVRETYSQRAVSMLREPSEEERAGGQKAYIVACVGKDPCATVDSADTAIEVGDDEFWMLLAGKNLSARDRRVLGAVAKQAAGLIKQRELAEEAGRAQAIVQADELRRSLLSAVSHDLRTPLAAAKVAVSSLRAEDVAFSPEDTAELLATIEESIDQLTALVGNLLDSSRLAAGVVRPDLRRVYVEEAVQRALVSIGHGATGFYRSAIDRVKVDVGD